MPQPPPRFTEVSFERMYPPQSVPEHVALMSFNGDSDCVRFHEWWEDEGAVAFAAWLADQKAKGE